MADSGFIVGLLLPLLAGFFNSSWNLPIKEKPRLWTAVVPEWSWEQFWLWYTLGSVFAVIAFTYGSLGASNLSEIFAATSSVNLVLMVTFSLLWGFGTMLCGLAVLLVGMGTGESCKTRRDTPR